MLNRAAEASVTIGIRGRAAYRHPQGWKKFYIYGPTRELVQQWFIEVANVAIDNNVDFDWESLEPEFYHGMSLELASFSVLLVARLW